MEFLARLITSALAVIVTSYLLPGVHVDGAITAIIVAAVLAFLNAIVKPILVLLTIPITVVTLGLFLLVINALMLMLGDWLMGSSFDLPIRRNGAAECYALMILAAQKIVPGFSVDGFWIALLFSIVLSVVNAVFEGIAGSSKN